MGTRLKLILISCLLLSFLALTLGSSQSHAIDRQKSKEKRAELSKIRIELDQTQEQIDSLRSVESELLNKLKNLDERIALDKEMIDKINRKISELRSSRLSAEKTFKNRQALLGDRKSEMRDQLARVYMDEFGEVAPPGEAGGAFLASVPEESWRGVYFEAISALSSSRVDVAANSATQAQSHLRSVKKSAKEVERLRKKRTASAGIVKSRKASSQLNLTKVRKTREQAADRLLYLSETERQMGELIARLEAKDRDNSLQSRDESQMTGLFIAQKGRFKLPVQGKVISGFGWKTDKVSNLKSFSPGIEIQGKLNYNVRVVAPGVVAYIGDLRGYGKFVIVGHDDGYYTTYGGLNRVKVVLGQRIPLREPVGVTGSGPIKFEIRNGKESVDPIAWLNFQELN